MRLIKFKQSPLIFAAGIAGGLLLAPLVYQDSSLAPMASQLESAEAMIPDEIVVLNSSAQPVKTETPEASMKLSEQKTLDTEEEMEPALEEAYTDAPSSEVPSDMELVQPLDSLWHTLTDLFNAGELEAMSYSTERAKRQLTELLLDNPPLLEEVLSRYQTGNDAYLEAFLGGTLGELKTPEVVDTALNLAANSDKQQRRKGLYLLSELSLPDPKVHTFVSETLSKETDPELLGYAVQALSPEIMAPEKHQHIVDQLELLSESSDSLLRANSLKALAKWDGSEDTYSLIGNALSDNDEQVQLAALQAIDEQKLRDAQLKRQILLLAEVSEQDSATQFYALEALRHYSLNTEEYEKIQSIRLTQ